MTASIQHSLTVLADVAGVRIRGLDEHQLDIVALRLVAEFGDEPVLSSIGRIVDEVRQSEGVAGCPVAHDGTARLQLVVSATSTDPRSREGVPSP
jgi:hypothetical protein